MNELSLNLPKSSYFSEGNENLPATSQNSSVTSKVHYSPRSSSNERPNIIQLDLDEINKVLDELGDFTNTITHNDSSKSRLFDSNSIQPSVNASQSLVTEKTQHIANEKLSPSTYITKRNRMTSDTSHKRGSDLQISKEKEKESCSEVSEVSNDEKSKQPVLKTNSVKVDARAKTHHYRSASYTFGQPLFMPTVSSTSHATQPTSPRLVLVSPPLMKKKSKFLSNWFSNQTHHSLVVDKIIYAAFGSQSIPRHPIPSVENPCMDNIKNLMEIYISNYEKILKVIKQIDPLEQAECTWLKEQLIDWEDLVKYGGLMLEEEQDESASLSIKNSLRVFLKIVNKIEENKESKLLLYAVMQGKDKAREIFQQLECIEKNRAVVSKLLEQQHIIWETSQADYPIQYIMPAHILNTLSRDLDKTALARPSFKTITVRHQDDTDLSEVITIEAHDSENFQAWYTRLLQACYEKSGRTFNQKDIRKQVNLLFDYENESNSAESEMSESQESNSHSERIQKIFRSIPCYDILQRLSDRATVSSYAAALKIWPIMDSFHSSVEIKDRSHVYSLSCHRSGTTPFIGEIIYLENEEAIVVQRKLYEFSITANQIDRSSPSPSIKTCLAYLWLETRLIPTPPEARIETPSPWIMSLEITNLTLARFSDEQLNQLFGEAINRHRKMIDQFHQIILKQLNHYSDTMAVLADGSKVQPGSKENH